MTIVGVAAEGFEGVEAGGSTDFWIPLQSRPELNAWGNPLEDGKTYIRNPTWWCLRLIGTPCAGRKQDAGGGATAVRISNSGVCRAGQSAAGRKETHA